jgi:methylglutaconyl-CoA hydratase
MSQQAVLQSVDPRGVATVTLNRPEVNNAYDEALIQGLHDAMDELGAHPGLRVVVLRGAGRHFQAGADLKWIRRVAAQPAAENEHASRATALAVHRLNRLPVPTVALVQGGCFGGGTGIVAACDVVIAAEGRRDRRTAGASLRAHGRALRRAGGPAHRPGARSGGPCRAARGR